MKCKKLFVFALAAMAFCACSNANKKSCQGECAQAECENKELPIAVQLYSVRGDMAIDFQSTLCKVRRMGYDGVEFAGLFGHSPAQIKHWCDSLGLVPISAHVSLAEMLEDVDKVMRDYKEIGCKYVVVPYVTEERRPGGDQYMQLIEEIKAIGKKANEAGLVLLYHNHDFEFNKLESGEIGLDYMYAHVDASLLQTELDMCWVKFAGYEPVDYLKKYDGRSPVVHLKDFYKGGENEQGVFEFRPLGTGVQDIPSIVEAAKAAGSKWLVVEQDSPSLDKSPLECIEMSITYLKSLSE